MKKLVTSILSLALAAGLLGGAAYAAGEGHDLKEATEHAAATAHYPILKPEEMDWSFPAPSAL